jgi:hypothetical protein
MPARAGRLLGPRLARVELELQLLGRRLRVRPRSTAESGLGAHPRDRGLEDRPVVLDDCQRRGGPALLPGNGEQPWLRPNNHEHQLRPGVRPECSESWRDARPGKSLYSILRDIGRGPRNQSDMLINNRSA